MRGAVVAGEDLAKEQGRVILTITRPGELAVCPFWLAFYKPGQVKADAGCRGKSIEERLIFGSTAGFREDQPVMMAHVEGQQHWHQLFLPVMSRHKDFVEAAAITKMVAGWNPERLGCYVAPELFKQPSCHLVLKAIIEDLVAKEVVSEIFLFTGSHGVNEVLAVASEMRMSMPDLISVLH